MKKMTFFTLTLLVLSTIGLQTAFAQVTLEGHTDWVYSVVVFTRWHNPRFRVTGWHGQVVGCGDKTKYRNT